MKIKDFYSEIKELKNQGYTSVKIRDWLETEKGLSVNERSVRRFFQQKGESFSNTAVKNTLGSFNMPEDQPWSTAWLKSKDVSLKINNPQQVIDLEDITDAIKEGIEGIEKIKTTKPYKTNKKALRAIISDAHVGMDTNTEDSVFGFKYNEKIFKKHLSVVFDNIKNRIDAHGDFDLIIVDDLGDNLDGFDGETTRGGHKLPQNMSNKDGWKAYVKHKLNTCVNIVNLGAANKYQFRSVSNDNHAGDWGYTANYAIKMAIESMFDNVEYIILDKHMEHFYYGDHAFLLAHGKDKKNMFKNMPLHLNDKVSNLIRQYIDHYEIKSKYIHVDKGDLHQVGYNREPKFDYRNYMSFAPPSPWVQSNFGVSYCGFSIQIIPKHSNQIQHTDVFFDLKKTGVK